MHLSQLRHEASQAACDLEFMRLGVSEPKTEGLPSVKAFLEESLASLEEKQEYAYLDGKTLCVFFLELFQKAGYIKGTPRLISEVIQKEVEVLKELLVKFEKTSESSPKEELIELRDFLLVLSNYASAVYYNRHKRRCFAA